MVRDTARRLTRHLRDRVDDDLRSVVIITPDDYEIQYLRDDLKESYSETQYRELVDSFRLEKPDFSPKAGRSPMGERRGIVHYHENAFIIQFPFSESESILVSLASGIGRNLLDFIEDLREIVHSDR